MTTNEIVSNPPEGCDAVVTSVGGGTHALFLWPWVLELPMPEPAMVVLTLLMVNRLPFMLAVEVWVSFARLIMRSKWVPVHFLRLRYLK